jgi:putative SOS response-associated peptidase YedK
VAQLLEADLRPEDVELYRPRYNIAPTDLHWVVRLAGQKRAMVPAGWGFARPDAPLLINARVETARDTPTFRDAFARHRCVVPADGFFEWRGAAKERRPIWFHPQTGLLLFAGIYEEREGAPPAFVILTTEANSTVAIAHDRMPVIVPASGVDDWLSRASIAPVAPDLLVATPVSRRVSSVAHDDPSCLDPDPGDPQLKLL